MNKRLTSVVLTSVMVAGNIVSSFASEENKSSKTKLELNKIKKEKTALINENKGIEKDITDTQSRISETKKDLQSVLDKKLQNEKELDNTEKKLDEEYDNLKDQMANYYMNSYTSNASVLKELITSKDASEFIVTSSHLKYIVDDRDKKVDEVSKLLEKHKELSKKISEDEDRLTSLQDKLVKEQNALEKESKENNMRIKSLNQEQARLEDILVVQQEEEARIKEAILKANAEKEAEEKKNNLSQNNTNKGNVAENNSVSNIKPSSTSSSVLQKPVQSYRITSKYGWRIHPVTGQRKFHYGIDLAAPKGTPILSSQSGTVVIAQYSSSYGNYIVVNHGNGLSTLYAHLSEMLVSIGDSVSTGQLIGKMGSTGMSTGSHLHYEVRVNGEKVDPMSKVNL